MSKETLILESKKIILAVDKTKIGVLNMFNHLADNEIDVICSIDDFIIENNHTDAMIEEAEFVEKRHLKQAVINAHNKYVTLLGRYQKEHSEKLTRLLTEKQ